LSVIFAFVNAGKVNGGNNIVLSFSIILLFALIIVLVRRCQSSKWFVRSTATT